MALPRSKLFWGVSLGHITNDLFMSMRSVVLTFMSAHLLPMTNFQIGQAVSLGEFMGAISQPFFGWLADKSGGRWLGVGGVIWVVAMQLTALFIASATGNYTLMLIPFVLSAVGSGAFHPVGVMHAASEGDGRRSASSMAYFFLFGQLGLAIGPALAGFLLDRTATHHNEVFAAPLGPAFSGRLIEHGSVTPIFAIGFIAIPTLLYMAFAMPRKQVYIQQYRKAQPASSGEGTLSGLPVKALLVLGVMILLRSLAANGSGVFLPRLFEQKGWDAAHYGLITSGFWLASGFTGVFFGHLADRYQRRAVIAVSLLLSAPVFFILPFIDGPFAFVLAILAGALGGGSHSVIVVLAQELIPGRKGFASGAIMGFIFATGALGSLFIGGISDQIGLTAAFQVVAVVTVIASLIGFLLPADRHKQAVPAVVESVETVPSGA